MSTLYPQSSIVASREGRGGGLVHALRLFCTVPLGERLPKGQSSTGRLLGAVLLAAGTLGCQREPLSDGLPPNPGCASCHGTGEDPAPPRALDGSTSTTALGVGAHQAHLKAGRVAGPVACAECHPIPPDMTEHPDLEAPLPEVVFGPLAALGTAPAWDRRSAQCSATYCHGATLSGADTRRPPVWTRVDGTDLTCTACHGHPPGGTHPVDTACEKCHGTVVGPGDVILAPALHVNGVVESGHPPGYGDPALHGPDCKQGRSDCRACHGAELQGVEPENGSRAVTDCDSCHQPGWRTNCVYCHGGSADASGAPPPDLLGNTDPSFLGVGAHAEHLSRTTHPAYPCEACHSPTTDVLTPGHLFDTTPGKSEVVLSGGLSPEGQYAAPACSNLYCHGSRWQGGSVPTFVPGAALGCESCHAQAKLGGGHTRHAASDCDYCHRSVVEGSNVITNPDLHGNGTFEVSMPAGTWNAAARTCVDAVCHGPGELSW